MKLPKSSDTLNLRYIYPSSNLYDFPDLPSQEFSFSPDDLYPAPFSQKDIKENNLLHFYIDDYRFEPFWRNPDKYLSKLLIPRYVVSPDFSLFPGMPYALQIYNLYRNRLLSLFMIYRGIRLIYNVRWSDPGSFQFSFSGIPCDQILSVHCSSSPDDFFLKGFFYMIGLLKPCFILFFGNPSFKVDIPHFIYPYCYY